MAAFVLILEVANKATGLRDSAGAYECSKSNTLYGHVLCILGTTHKPQYPSFG